MAIFVKYIKAQLRKPSTGFWGFVTRKLILDYNARLSQETFKRLHAKESDCVMEIGFGYGSGLSYALDSTLRKGTGKLLGVDYSPTACESVRGMLEEDVRKGKLQIFNTDVSNMPLNDEVVDKAFHVNCFYFWPNIGTATGEIKRVLKPGGLLVTGLNLARLEKAGNRGFLDYHQYQPKRYLDALQEAGFVDIRKEDCDYGSSGATFTFIHANKPK